MKVTLLIADCNTTYLRQSVETIVNVLKELDVQIHKVDLYQLPYFMGQRTKEMNAVVNAIEDSKGVIAISNVPMLSMHAAMQSFFDNASLYDETVFNKAMLAITYSEWLGEVEAAERMLKSWNILGGMEGGKVCFTNKVAFAQVATQLEKEIESFYRLMKQERSNIGSSERLIYRAIKQGKDFSENIYTNNAYTEQKKSEQKSVEIKSFADMLKTDLGQKNTTHIISEKPNMAQSQEENGFTNRIDLSTKEQTIKEINHLLNKEPEDEFVSMNTGIYRRPVQSETIKNKRLQQIPHYFIAQHEKSLKAILKYQITDLNEEGYIIIQDGDCSYRESIEGMSTVELILTDEVLKEILAKHMTYQKAFMLGKLKVKGNFAILPKLDQIFKAI